MPHLQILMHKQILNAPACEIRSFESADELVDSATRDWLELMQVMEMAGREPTVALSGGRIAGKLLTAAGTLFSHHLSLIRKTQFFWSDERCVPPEHSESNYALAMNHLLKPLQIPEVNVHRIPGEFEPDLAATTAAKGLAKWMDADAGDVPALDLVLLGMGEEGHVASLFPGESVQVMDAPDLFRAVTAQKPPPARVTMSYGILSKAENVWVLASGTGKDEALKSSLSSSEATPLARVLASRSDTRIYTDISTAEGFMA